MRIILLLFLLLSLSVQLPARQIMKHHPTVRALSLGNAFTAISDDYGALYYNPAGLGRQLEWTLEVLTVDLEVGQNSIKAFNDTLELAEKMQGSPELGDILETMQKNLGQKKNMHARVGIHPYLMLPIINFGIGFFFDTSIDLVFHRDPSAEMRVIMDAGMVTGYAHNFFNKRLTLGATIQPTVRASIDEEFGINLLDSDKDFIEYGGQGIGTGVDLGLMFTPYKKWKPTLGLSILDIGDTNFQPIEAAADVLGVKTEDLVAPLRNPQSVNIGFSIKPSWRKLYSLISFDIQDINQAESFGKKLHFGTEFGWGRWVKLGLGINQFNLSDIVKQEGWTAGISLNVMVIRIQVVTYAEELGPVAGSNPDRRYLFHLKALL